MKANKNLFPRRNTSLCFWLLLALSTTTYSEEQTTPPDDATMVEEQNNEEQPTESSEEANKRKAESITSANNKHLELLRAQYPKGEITQLQADGESFTALWRKDRSGDALGAVLLIPAVGQTANWPNTIDVLRNELPLTGWSTLSIDLKVLDWQKKTDSTENVRQADESNLARIRAAVDFLHSEGQYNIVLAGYGQSADRVIAYTKLDDASGMQKNVPSTKSTKKKRPVRALILIGGTSYSGGKLSPSLESYPFNDMPVLDIIFGAHYLDTLDAQARKAMARAEGFATFVQVKTVEPSSTMFNNENRLSRRVRGFLNRYAKGVEIDRR